MGGAFDKKGSGAETGKRPTPTIEGTATEVSVEPEAEAIKEPESESKDEAEEAATASDQTAQPNNSQVDKRPGRSARCPGQPPGAPPRRARGTTPRAAAGRSLRVVAASGLI